MGRLYSIAANTFLETIRQPIYGVILLLTFLLLVLNVSLAAFTLDDDDKLLMELGLSTLLLSGVFLSAFSASGVISREIDNKTVLTVISKPVARPTFIAGKFLGLIAALTVAFYLSFLAFVLTVRHRVLEAATDKPDWPVILFGCSALLIAALVAGYLNFSRGRDFISNAVGLLIPCLTAAATLICFIDRDWKLVPFGQYFVGSQIVRASLLVLLAVVVIAAVALAASTRLGQVMTLLTCVLVLVVGSVADYALAEHAESSRLAAAAYQIVPNFGFFWVVDAVTGGIPIPTGYVVRVAAYAVLSSAAVLLVGVALFQNREVG